MTIRLFLFDLDGTLVDTAPDLALAVNMVRTARGIAPLPEEELRPYASRGAPVMLEALRAAGIRTGVVTNKVEHLALRLTDNLGLDGQLDVVLGSDSEGCAMKPAPDSLLTAARLTGVHVTDILYAGDAPRDVAAAHAAGMPCAACTWGYAVTPPESWGADLVAHSPAELATWAVQLNAHAL